MPGLELAAAWRRPPEDKEKNRATMQRRRRPKHGLPEQEMAAQFVWQYLSWNGMADLRKDLTEAMKPAMKAFCWEGGHFDQGMASTLIRLAKTSVTMKTLSSESIAQSLVYKYLINHQCEDIAEEFRSLKNGTSIPTSDQSSLVGGSSWSSTDLEEPQSTPSSTQSRLGPEDLSLFHDDWTGSTTDPASPVLPGIRMRRPSSLVAQVKGQVSDEPTPRSSWYADPTTKPMKAEDTSPKRNNSSWQSRSPSFLCEGSESSQEMLSLAPIMLGFGDVIERLRPHETSNEIDKVIKYILDQNIMVKKVDLKFPCMKLLSSAELIMRALPFVKIGRFTLGKDREEGCIAKRWDELVKQVPILSPDRCCIDFRDVKCSHELDVKKRNILGCYLGQDFPNRIACDVFDRFCRIYAYNSGSFTPEEDQIIISRVQEYGKKWSLIAKELNRRICSVQARHEILSLSAKKICTGKWTEEEDTILLEALFAHKGEAANAAYIESIKMCAFTEVAQNLNRLASNVRVRWCLKLKPILLSYFYHTLHDDPRDKLAAYLIANRIDAVQELDYKELKRLFPHHNPRSLVAMINGLVKGSNTYCKGSIYRQILTKGSSGTRFFDQRNAAQRNNIVRTFNRIRFS